MNQFSPKILLLIIFSSFIDTTKTNAGIVSLGSGTLLFYGVIVAASGGVIIPKLFDKEALPGPDGKIRIKRTLRCLPTFLLCLICGTGIALAANKKNIPFILEPLEILEGVSKEEIIIYNSHLLEIELVLESVTKKMEKSPVKTKDDFKKITDFLINSGIPKEAWRVLSVLNQGH